jgi:hypothetical protein
MGLTAFTDTDSILSRDRLGLDLFEAHVMIALGNLTDETAPTDTAGWAALKANFSHIGKNAKDSPTFNDEPVLEDIDLHSELIGHNAMGDIILKEKLTQEFHDLYEAEIMNNEVTILIIPPDEVGKAMLINGVKISLKTEGKGNSDSRGAQTFSYKKRCKKLTSVYSIWDIPTATES